MPSQRLVVVMAAVFLIAAVLMYARRAQEVADDVTAPRRAPAGPSSVVERSDLRTYAIALPELQGLSADTKPGSALELWVTWDGPVRQRPRVEPLIDRAVLERIVPPLTPGAPDTALLEVPATEIRRLLYADRYGLLSATVLPRAITRP